MSRGVGARLENAFGHVRLLIRRGLILFECLRLSSRFDGRHPVFGIVKTIDVWCMECGDRMTPGIVTGLRKRLIEVRVEYPATLGREPIPRWLRGEWYRRHERVIGYLWLEVGMRREESRMHRVGIGRLLEGRRGHLLGVMARRRRVHRKTIDTFWASRFSIQDVLEFFAQIDLHKVSAERYAVPCTYQ